MGIFYDLCLIHVHPHQLARRITGLIEDVLKSAMVSGELKVIDVLVGR